MEALAAVSAPTYTTPPATAGEDWLRCCLLSLATVREDFLRLEGRGVLGIEFETYVLPSSSLRMPGPNQQRRET